MLANYQKTK